MATLIEVLAPNAEQVAYPEPVPTSDRLPGLSGRSVALVMNSFNASGAVAVELERRLVDHGATVRVVRKNYWHSLTTAQRAELAARDDAVILGLGATPPATAVCIRDGVALERLGTATVTIASELFAPIVDGTAAAGGMPAVRRLLLPFRLDEQPDRAAAAAGQAFDQVIAALTDGAAPAILRPRRTAVAADD